MPPPKKATNLTQWQRWYARQMPAKQAGRISFRSKLRRFLPHKLRAEDASAFLAAIVTSSADAIVGKTLDGTVTSWNEGAARLFGYSEAEMIGQPIRRVIPQDRQGEEDHILARIAAGQRIDHYEAVRLHKDGRLIDVSVTVSPVRNAAGKIVGASKIVRDITERKKAEKWAREREERRYSDLLEANPFPMWIIDTGTLRFLEVNGSALATFGYSRDEFLRMTIANLKPAGGVASLQKALLSAATGQAAVSNWALKRKDGADIKAEITWCSMTFAGRPACFALIHDLTAHKQAEEALRAERSRQLDDRLPNSAIYRYAREANGTPCIHYISAGIEQLNGVTIEDVLRDARVLLNQILPEYMPQFTEAEQRSARNLSDFEMELPMRRPDGEVRWMRFQSRPSRMEGGGVMWDGVQTDITKQKRTEAFLRRLALVTEQASEFIGFADTEFKGGFLNPAGRRLVGIPDNAPIETYRVIDFFAPEELERAQNAIIASLTKDGSWVGETRLRHFVSGDTVPVHCNAFAIRDASGCAVGYACITTNLTRQKHEAALRESEERFRGIFEHAGTGIAITDMRGQFESCNPAYRALLGYSEHELRALQFAELVHPEDREKNVMEFRRLAAEKIPSFEVVNRYVAKDGRPLWVQKHVSLLRDAAGTPTHIISLVTDISERKRREEQSRLLMRELNHRSKNMFALVQAIARQTFTARPDAFLDRFGERMEALAASQDLLVRNEWQGVDLEELVRSQLAHFKDLIGIRITLQGPSVFISASAAQTLGMALHELATNAGKYGVLSCEGGSVEIRWSLEGGPAAEETFVIEWCERGGPSVTEPSKRGFGSAILCDVTESSLNAKVELGFPIEGLTWRLRCPAAEVVEASTSNSP